MDKLIKKDELSKAKRFIQFEGYKKPKIQKRKISFLNSKSYMIASVKYSL